MKKIISFFIVLCLTFSNLCAFASIDLSSVRHEPFELIGKTYSEIESEYGEITLGSNYAGAGYYYIEDVGVWAAFYDRENEIVYCYVKGPYAESARRDSDGYEFPDSDAVCISVMGEISSLVDNLSEESYTVEEISDITGFDFIDEGYSDFDDCYIYSVEYDDLYIWIRSLNEEIKRDEMTIITAEDYDNVKQINLANDKADTVDYNKIYLNYGKDADINYNNKLNDAVSGMILLDLNQDNVPELLGYSRSVSHFDAEGNQLYPFKEGGLPDPEYDNPAYKEYDYNLKYAFSIIDGKIIEDSPWRNEMYSETIRFPFPPDEIVEDTESLCTTVRYNRGSEDYLIMYDAEFRGYTILWYNEEGFDYSRGEFNEDFFDLYYTTDLPVASIHFYDDEKQQKRTRSEAMEILLNKYNEAAEAYEYSGGNDEQSKVSDWAIAEVNKAKEFNLIPQEMLNDDLTENITRAEFAAIAMQLHQAIVGEELNWHGGYIVDIDDNKYQMYIRGAYNFGITSGTGEKDGGVIFSPDLNITREQLAAMLGRVIKCNKFEDWSLENDSDFPFDIGDTNKFSDDDRISDYAKESVYYMSENDIIQGVDSTHFAPLATATKEQAILLALRIYLDLCLDIYFID